MFCEWEMKKKHVNVKYVRNYKYTKHKKTKTLMTLLKSLIT